MEASMENREHWLNGWYREGSFVLIGNVIRCAGCGRAGGITTVVIEDIENYQPPEKYPDWPFPENDCPVCWMVDEPEETEETVIDRLANLPLSILRKAIQRRKARPE